MKLKELMGNDLPLVGFKLDRLSQMYRATFGGSKRRTGESSPGFVVAKKNWLILNFPLKSYFSI